MANSIILVGADRSRRRTTRTFEFGINSNYVNPGPNYFDPTTALDPNYLAAGISGLLDPFLSKNLEIVAKATTLTPCIVAGVVYKLYVIPSPVPTSWADAFVWKLISDAGAELANGTATGVVLALVEMVGPNGSL